MPCTWNTSTVVWCFYDMVYMSSLDNKTHTEAWVVFCFFEVVAVFKWLTTQSPPPVWYRCFSYRNTFHKMFYFRYSSQSNVKMKWFNLLPQMTNTVRRQYPMIVSIWLHLEKLEIVPGYAKEPNYVSKKKSRSQNLF